MGSLLAFGFLLLVHDSDEPNAAWFNGLQLGGSNCCGNHGDCHPTAAWHKEDHWQAVWEKADGSRQVVDIPPDRILLPEVPNPTGMAVLCMGVSTDIDNHHTEVFVRCFVPGAET